MKKKYTDGIILDNTVYISDENPVIFSNYMKIMQLIAIMIASYNTVWVFITCLNLPISPYGIGIWVMIFGVVLFFLYITPSHDAVKLTVLPIFYLLILYLFRKQLINAFYIIENAIINRINSYYGLVLPKFMADYNNGESDITFFVILISFLIVAVISATILKSRFYSLCNIIMLVPIAAYFVFGMIPSAMQLIVFILMIIFISKSYGAGRGAVFNNTNTLLHRINIRAAAILCIVVMAILILMRFILSPVEYEEITKIQEVKSDIQSFMYDFSIDDITEKINDWKFNSKGNASRGGLNSGELGKVDQIQFTGSKQLIIKAPATSVSEGIYLKGYTGSVYTGSSWEKHSGYDAKHYKSMMKSFKQDYPEPVNQSYYLINEYIKEFAPLKQDMYLTDIQIVNSLKKGKISIEYREANKKFVYAPYLTDFNTSMDIGYLYDLYAIPEYKKSGYEFEYFYGMSFSKTLGRSIDFRNLSINNYVKFEELYSNYVHDVYTRLPDKGIDRLKGDFIADKGISTKDAIEKVMTYLHENTSYSLSPGKTPNSKDFVEFFLYENNKGYCSHYASAAVLMLRVMGIPARYAEGYAIGVSDEANDKGYQKVSIYKDDIAYDYTDNQVEVMVKDYNAHAWAEVYMDGCGWLPVEFTPGSDILDTNNLISSMEEIGENLDNDHRIKPEATPTIKPTEEPLDETKQKEHDKGNGKDNDSSNVNPPSDNDGSSGNQGGMGDNSIKGKDANISKAIIIIIVIITLLLIISLLLFILIYKKKKAKDQGNESIRALQIYANIEKILKACRAMPKKGKDLEDYVDYVEKNCAYVDGDSLSLCMETVNKARFGRYIIKKEDLYKVEEYYQKVCSNIYNDVSSFRKLIIKFRLII